MSVLEAIAASRVPVEEMSKADFLVHLSAERPMLIAFYESGDALSESAVGELEAFAVQVATHHPDLHLRKVNHRNNPYLTARMLLTEIPELHLLLKDEGSEWTSYKIEIGDEPGALAEFMDSQRWRTQAPVGGSAQMFCSPFNACGKTLAVIAEMGHALEAVLPLPRWLALIVIPAMITLVGRFIIQG
ncbi:hypothetical protein LPJ61_005026, partial [Coemansia biformis]